MTPQVKALLPDPDAAAFLMNSFHHQSQTRTRNNCDRSTISLVEDHPVSCQCETGGVVRWDDAFNYQKNRATAMVGRNGPAQYVQAWRRPSWRHSHP